MRIRLYQVDALTNRVFGGNPAAVCIIDKWLEDVLMQQIAAENNLSETAFVMKFDNAYEIRWFTPNSEVDLCGHATLATAHVLLIIMVLQVKRLFFIHRNGEHSA